jgi:hypothetical protein
VEGGDQRIEGDRANKMVGARANAFTQAGDRPPGVELRGEASYPHDFDARDFCSYGSQLLSAHCMLSDRLPLPDSPAYDHKSEQAIFCHNQFSNPSIHCFTSSPCLFFLVISAISVERLKEIVKTEALGSRDHLDNPNESSRAKDQRSVSIEC